jgi:hypothetical protein
MNTIEEIGKFLLEYAPVILAVKEVVESGASVESVTSAIRQVKVKASDEAFKEELGLKP